MNKTMELSVYNTDITWLMEFAELHNITTTEETIRKLIEIHKAWNGKMGTLIDSPNSR